MKIVVTAGQSWVDIDAFACIIAYTELLKLEGKEAEAVNPGALNSSIPDYLAKLGEYQTEPSDINCAVALVDISDPKYVSSFVKPENVIKVYDHHLGFEDYWGQRIGDDAHIEFIGACATLVWEEYKKRGLANAIGANSATLLAAAIVSNTLNFKASMTNKRDREAFIELSTRAKLTETFSADYFRACEASVVADISSALKNDTKVCDFPNLGASLVIGQCELWKSKDFIREHRNTISEALAMTPNWILTSPSISEGINHLYTTNVKMKDWFTQAISANWDGDFGTTDRLYLRKEIIPALQKL